MRYPWELFTPRVRILLSELPRHLSPICQAFYRFLPAPRQLAVLFALLASLVGVVVGYNLFQYQKVNDALDSIKDERLVRLGSFHEVDLFVMWGDICDPKKYTNTVEIDAPVISMTVNDLELPSISMNLLARSCTAFLAEGLDDELSEKLVDNLLLETRDAVVKRRRVLTWNTASEATSIGLDYRQADFFQRTRITHFIVIPMFESADWDEASAGKRDRIKRRFEKNISLAVRDALQEAERKGEIQRIAFPALAGSEFLLDSQNTLTYKQSWSSIMQELHRELPQTPSLREIYFVLWDGSGAAEFEAARSGLIAAYVPLFQTGPHLLEFVILLAILSYTAFTVIEYRERRTLKALILEMFVGVFAVVVALYALPTRDVADWVAELDIQNQAVAETAVGLAAFGAAFIRNRHAVHIAPEASVDRG